MVTLRFVSTNYVSPFHTITVRTNIDGWDRADIEGKYEFGEWSFELPDQKYRSGFEFKFVLNKSQYMDGDNITIPPNGDSRYVYSAKEVRFLRHGPVAERGEVHNRLFETLIPPDEVFDVIIVGSGMGGGVLADQLSDAGMSVLVLEAGGYLFPTHIANLPRRIYPGEFKKHVWELWNDFRAVNYDSEPIGGARYAGGYGFNLGGRSVFWGGFIPRMSSWELDFWPRSIKWYLEDTGYQQAEDVMGRSSGPATFYNREVHNLLRLHLPDFHHIDAAVAVRQNLIGANTISPGMFSTADLLIESYLTARAAGDHRLTMLLNHEVLDIIPGSTVEVRATDLRAGVKRAFKGKHLVLCAGTIESARLVHYNGLAPTEALIGSYMTDHPIHFTHFSIPKESPLYDQYGSVKTLSQPKERPVPDGLSAEFNILLELGADFNQGRFVDEDIININEEEKRGMLCEVVFLHNAELNRGNRLDFPLNRLERPIVRMGRCPLRRDVVDKREALRKLLLAELGAVELQSGEGGLGVAGHEVGTLRIELKDCNRGQCNLPGAVDENLKLVTQENIYACDLSVFPTSPAANPSLTLVALAIRLKDHLTKRMR